MFPGDESDDCVLFLSDPLLETVLEVEAEEDAVEAEEDAELLDSSASVTSLPSPHGIAGEPPLG